MKTIFISGAFRGLGAATAELFIEHGFRVIAADILFPEMIDFRPVKELIQVPLDVSSSEDVEKVAEELKTMGIHIDYLVNNAGFFDMYPLTENDPASVEKMMSTNCLGALRLVRAFLHDLSRSKGRVIQISSESVKIPGLFQPYQVSKIALEALSRSIRQELALKDIRLIIIRPGALNTRFFGPLDEYRNPVPDSLFHDEFQVFVKSTTRFVNRIIEPEKAARLIYRAIAAKRPRNMYRINNNPVLTVFSKMPGRMMDRVVINIVRKRS
jgi:NAD(P)-dependent dehydrogenase (short-subunit alcohol dehydrogenase family)